MGEDSSIPLPEPLALCGIGCRFPGGVRDTEAFWEFLKDGKSAISEVPRNRWDVDRYFHPNPDVSGRMITRWGGFVEGLEQFDAAFWGISPREAARMDPQQRWLLEAAWEAIEDAGIPPSALRGSNTGVFVGISSNDYGSLQLSDFSQIDVHTNSGGTLSIAANRISYQFDLKGPSLAIDTACSSALVAISQACQAIWSRECEATLAGGVNALITPHTSVGFSKASMLSPSGTCFAFDARADGYVRGEGVGLILLQPLSRALEDRTRIHAVIRSAVVNQDGHSSTMTVPSVESQEVMLRSAYEAAGIPPELVAYVEAHGTGTPVGDPIEAMALGRVLGAGRGRGEPCVIGSVKTNLGHLESASGIAGLIKAALVLERGWIPPSLNFETPNPEIPFDELRLRVATEGEPLALDPDRSPVAAVNSFGFGGTNAHVVLGRAPSSVEGESREQTEPAARPHVLPVSARDEASLRKLAIAYRQRLEEESVSPRDLCAAAGARKDHHERRLVFLGDDGRQLRDRIDRWVEKGDEGEGIVAGSSDQKSRSVVFVFTGQGPQWWAMGRQLLEREPAFRQRVQEIDFILEPLTGWSLQEELARSEAESKIDQTSVAQPAIFAVQMGLVALWKSWGIAPEAVVGHSVGEVAAACCAGIFSVEDAVRIVVERSRLQETTGGNGRMLAAGLSPREARDLIRSQAGRVDLTAINSPDLVTLGGDREPMEEIGARLESEGRFVRWLPIDYAFHTHQMEPIRKELLAALAGIRPGSGDVPFVSTVTGDRMSGERLDADYWWRNVRHPVLFGPAITGLARDSDRVFLEIGPHPSLKSSLSQCLAAAGGRPHDRVFHSLHRDGHDSEEMLTQLAKLHLSGVPIDWEAVNQSAGPVVGLPRYPWHYRAHWLDQGEMAARLQPEPHTFLGKRLPGPKPVWEGALDPERFPFLRDHRIWNSLVFPASGYGEIGLALAAELFPGEACAIEAIESVKALFLSETEPRRIRVELEPSDRSFTLFSAGSGSEDWELNARGRLVSMNRETPVTQPVDLGEIRSRLIGPISHDQFYAEFDAIGYQFGGAFRQIREMFRTEGEALVEIPVPDGLEPANEAFHFHPSLLDACFQASRGVRGLAADGVPEDHLFLPESIRRIHCYRNQLPRRLWAQAVQLESEASAVVTDIFVWDEAGLPVAEILGFRASRMANRRSVADLDDCLYQFQWQSAPSTVEALEETGAEESRPVLPGPCIILSDRGGVADAVVRRAKSEDTMVVGVQPGSGFEETGPNRFSIDPDSEADLRQVLATMIDRKLEPVAILHCGALDVPEAAGQGDLDPLAASSTAIVHSALSLCRALEQSSFEKTPRVYFITRDSEAVVESDAVAGLAAAPLVGFARVANNEHPRYRWTTIDLGACDVETAAGFLADEIAGDRRDREVAFRHGTRFARELVRVSMDSIPDRTQRIARGEKPSPVPFRLETGKPGVLAGLSLHETWRRAPCGHEVEILVNAGGVNFRDVMKAMGMYPGNPVDLEWFGDDFSGTILRVGKKVAGYEPGDRVGGIAPYSFRSHVTADHRLVFKLPPEMTFEEAATLPTVFLTAHHSLCQLANLQPGEKVLIHAGAGGVGQAAIQVAQHLGLEIFATAGSPEKRQLLRDLEVPHVMDSRSLAFADEIMEITRGEGVDAVLNSLAGPFIPKSLSVLAPFGRFLEIGKVDIYSKSKLGLELLKDSISVFVIDLAQQLERQPQRIAALFSELATNFTEGIYRPLPRTVFPVSDCREAFRFMARAQHLGKVVLSFEAPADLELGPCTEVGHLFRSDATYLVVGGAGGFGWTVAKWMAEQGARNLVLLSRTGPRGEAAAEIRQLRDEGINLIDRRGDVTDTGLVSEVIAGIESDLPPLKGVIHAAMVLEDDWIAALDEERFDRALLPKILGAWNLHQATRELELDHFIGFSSFSAIIGGPKQANYNAGNAFLDALAHYRRSRGLPALTIDWGALAGAGFVERNRKTADYLEKTGMGALPVAKALRCLGELIRKDPGQIGAARVDWQKLGRFNSLVADSPAFDLVAREASDDFSGGSILARVMKLPPAERSAAVEEFLAEKVSGVLGIDPAQLERSQPVTQLGLDSLMAVELINGLEGDLGVNLPMGSLMGGPSVGGLAELVLAALDDGQANGNGDFPADGIRAGGRELKTESERLAFWIEALEGVPADVHWPGDRSFGTGGRVRQEFHLSPELAHAIFLLAAEHGVSPGTTLLAAFETLLHAFTGQEEILVGVSLPERSGGPVPCRSRLNGEADFSEFLADTHAGFGAIIEVPLPEISTWTDALHSGGDNGSWPLHRVEFELADGPSVGTPSQYGKQELKLAVVVCDGAVSGQWIGAAPCFDPESIERIHALFLGTLERVVSNLDLSTVDLVPLTTEERAQAQSNQRNETGPVLRFRKPGAVAAADFLADARLDSSIRPASREGRPFSAPSRVFLTGGTGFLGAFLLDELLKRTDAEIDCLVRSETEAEGAERLRDNLRRYGFDPTGFDQRINTVEGDLAKPFLGLTEARFDELADRIGAIYHNGADVNLVLPYQALRDVNVNGTREILRLACRGEAAIPTHVVSTFTVHTTADNRGAEVREYDPLPPCESLLYGYSQSKWVSENLVGEARRRGLPVSLYRPGHITGDSRTGASNTGDLLHTMLLVCWQLGAAPLRDSEFDVTPVDFVARAIVSLSQQGDALGRNFLLTNPSPLKTREFAEWIHRQQLGVEAVPYESWRQQLLETARLTQSDEIRPLVEILAPRALADDDAIAVHPRFVSDWTTGCLKESGIACPPADPALFSTYLEFLQSTGGGRISTVAEALS